MAIYIIPRRLQRVWNEWNLRTAVLSSLCFQILLIFLSPMRKRTRGILVNSIIWLCYLMADWVATYAIGIIVNNQSGGSCDDDKCVSTALAAFWAPFLLLHLGGPDSITAFSLEDNELWMRHMFGLITEVVMVGYVFSLAIPNAFWLPSIFVYVAGTVKYFERTRSLYLACLRNLKDSLRSDPTPGPDFAQIADEYAEKVSTGIGSVPEADFVVLHALTDTMTSDDDRTKDMAIVQDGCTFYHIFRGLIVDHMFSFRDYRDSSWFISRLKPEDAFKVMAVELNFMYDELFTKMSTLHRAGYFGFILRFTCIVSVVVAVVLFVLHPKKSLHSFDIAFTYALLIGAVILDFVALIKLMLSDWTIALLSYHFHDHRKALEVIYPIYKRINYSFRWSDSLSQHSLISYCMIKKSRRGSRIRFDKVVDYFGLESTFEELRYKQDRSVSQGLKELIYNGLKEKSAGLASMQRKDTLSSRGKGVIIRYGINNKSVVWSVSEDVEYDESVLLWHIATDLLYFTFSDNKREEGTSSRIVPPHDGDDDCQDHREICKILSDYMLYLFVMRPSLMSTVVGICRTRFEDTCAEAMRFFDRDPSLSKETDACNKLLSVNTELSPSDVKGDRSKSMLFNACILAKGLKSITNDKKLMWEIMSNVWLELLCYGAVNCRGDAHAQQLSKGGELIAFVWLLMAHFGLSNQFMIDTGHVKTRIM